MLVHREYTNAYPSSFVIYRDKVETKNANKPHLYGQLLPDNFEPFPKNPHIIQIFTQIGRSEELGTGIRNVYKYTKAYSGEDNIEFEEKDIFVTQVPLGDIFVDKGLNSVGEKVTDKVTDNQQRIINELFKNQYITTKELSEIIGISTRKIKENIAKLKDKEILERIGAEKSGYWKIIEKQ